MKKTDIEQFDLETTRGSDYLGDIYFNGFEVGFSNSDASIDLIFNSKNIAKLNLSFGTLKSLSEITSQIVEDIETRTGKVNSINEFKDKMIESLEKEEKDE